MADRRPGGPRRTAFLLSQLGSLSAARFAERTRRLGLTPSEAGVLRLLGHAPGLNQRSLADRIGATPSRVVALVDGLEDRALLRRRRSAADRRNQELTLTDAGRAALGRLRAAAEAHEEDVLAPLSAEQATQLASILTTLAAGLDLDGELHRDTAGARRGRSRRA